MDSLMSEGQEHPLPGLNFRAENELEVTPSGQVYIFVSLPFIDQATRKGGDLQRGSDLNPAE